MPDTNDDFRLRNPILAFTKKQNSYARIQSVVTLLFCYAFILKSGSRNLKPLDCCILPSKSFANSRRKDKTAMFLSAL